MKKMNKHQIIFALLAFVFAFASLVIVHRIVGYTHVANLDGSVPLTWEEIVRNLSLYFVVALALTIFLTMFLIKSEKHQKKTEEEVHVRIAEKQRKKFERRIRAKKIAKKMSLFKLDANLRNIPVYTDNSSAVNRAYELYRYKKYVFGEAVCKSKKVKTKL